MKITERFAHIRHDSRTRHYLPVTRVMSQTYCTRAELLIGNLTLQPHFNADTAVCFIHPGGSVVVDFGCELNGGVRIVTAQKLSCVHARIRFGESFSECCGNPSNDHSIHDAVHPLAGFGATEIGGTGFRFVRIDCPPEAEKPLELLAVVAVLLIEDLEYIGSFESDDALLNQIWQTAAYTVQLNMQDYVFDGIKRDRLVWMGDLHPELRVAGAVFDNLTGFARSMDFARDHTANHEFMSGISSYSLWWLICQYEYYLFTGDRAYLETQRDYLLELLDAVIAMTGDDGTEQLPERRFMDWSTVDDPAAIHVGLQGILALTLRCGAQLARALDATANAAAAAHGAARAANAAPPPTVNKGAAALWALGRGGTRLGEREFFARDPGCGFSAFTGFYVLQARAQAGDCRGALALLRDYWGGMLSLGATTFWEDFDRNWLVRAGRIDEPATAEQNDVHANCGKCCYQGLRHSLCHGWAGGPAAFLSETVLGVKILAPGMTRVAITPDLGDLQCVTGTFPTPYGEPLRIRAWRAADGTVQKTVTAPTGIRLVGPQG